MCKNITVGPIKKLCRVFTTIMNIILNYLLRKWKILLSWVPACLIWVIVNFFYQCFIQTQEICTDHWSMLCGTIFLFPLMTCCRIITLSKAWYITSMNNWFRTKWWLKRISPLRHVRKWLMQWIAFGWALILEILK